MNDPNASLVSHRQHHWIAKVSAFTAIAFAACSSEMNGGDGPPVFNPVAEDAPSPAGAGGAANGPSGMSGASGVLPSTEQPAAGNGTAIAGNAGAGGSATANGTAGSSMVGAGGSGMVAAAGSGMVAAAGSSMTPDGSAGAGGQPATPTLTPCENGALFCEDFEGLALGALPVGFNGLEPERAVSVIADPARGQVLRVQSGAGYGNKAGIFLNDFTPPDNSHFGRMFVNVAAFPVAESDHWVLVEATGDVGDQIRPVGGQFQRWAPGADGPSAGDWTDWQQSTVATVAGAWECVEWQMNGANGGNDISIWIDDVQVQPLDRPAFTFPAINRLWIGWVVYQMGEPSQYDVRIDDIVLSSQRIGCD